MYVYRTSGVCPAEIHFQLSGNVLSGVKFVGGGCKGNARLLERLLEGKGLGEVIPMMEGILCRNDTSCPDQLFRAVGMALRGDLAESDPVRVFEDPAERRRVAVTADLNGRPEALGAVLGRGVDAVYCLGNLTGPGGDNDSTVEMASRENVVFAQGPYDRTLPCGKPENRDVIRRAPHFINFRLGPRRALGFYGGFIQEFEGFSDFSPHSLELLMVSNLSDYLRNVEVYPALLAMTEQFGSDVVLFAHTGICRHVRLGRVDFVNVGPAEQGGRYRYALLEWEEGDLKVSFEEAECPRSAWEGRVFDGQGSG
ncbi:MAG: TSCPD domain-containing protein [Desulfocucumaceae bacterium]